MITSKVEYLGDLRTKCTHLQSQTEIITDAPIDNNGKGEAFSPTDLVATAYASCMITIMGIFCNNHEISFIHAEANVQKIMAAEPRRIGKIVIELDLTKSPLTRECEHFIECCNTRSRPLTDGEASYLCVLT